MPAVAVENIFLWNLSESAFPFPREPHCSPPYFDFIWGWKERNWLRKTGGAGVSNYLRPGSGHPIISLCYNCPSCRRIQISVGVSGIKRFIVRQEVRLATEIRGPCRDLSYIWIWDGPGCRPNTRVNNCWVADRNTIQDPWIYLFCSHRGLHMDFRPLHNFLSFCRLLVYLIWIYFLIFLTEAAAVALIWRHLRAATRQLPVYSQPANLAYSGSLADQMLDF